MSIGETNPTLEADCRLCLDICGMTLIAGAIAAILAMQLTSWDWLTCLLVTAPGGLAEMILGFPSIES